MSSSIAQKFKNIGPGALVAAGFIGPGTVTTCTVSGASYGYTMLWALLFATVATIIFQEMASRVGIVSGKGLGENIRESVFLTRSRGQAPHCGFTLLVIRLFPKYRGVIRI